MLYVAQYEEGISSLSSLRLLLFAPHVEQRRGLRALRSLRMTQLLSTMLMASCPLTPTPTGDLVQDLITLGRKFLGKPYRYRGSLPWAMDCSGYVRYLFSCFGINLSGSSADLAKVTRTVQNPRPGDLLFFKGRNRRSDRIGHVALVVKVQGSRITMMHSTNSRGIVQEELQSSAYFSSRYIRAGRVPYLERTYSAAYREEDEKAQEKLLPIPAQALAWQAPNLFSTSFFGCVED